MCIKTDSPSEELRLENRLAIREVKYSRAELTAALDKVAALMSDYDSWQIRGQPMRSWQKALFAASRNGTFSRDKPRNANKKAAGMARDLPEDLPAGVYNL